MRKRDVFTYRQYADMSYRELHRELEEMLQRAERLSVRFEAVERIDLLPALQAMHDKVAQPGRRVGSPSGTPTWEEECRSLGITPELVRQGRRRTQAETDIRHLLGEERTKRGLAVGQHKGAEAEDPTLWRPSISRTCVSYSSRIASVTRNERGSWRRRYRNDTDTGSDECVHHRHRRLYCASSIV